jgi:hypothetical protein
MTEKLRLSIDPGDPVSCPWFLAGQSIVTGLESFQEIRQRIVESLARLEVQALCKTIKRSIGSYVSI